MNRLAVLATLLLTLASVSSVSAQSAKKYKIGALTKSLANPYFLLLKQGYDYAQKKPSVDVVFDSTPKEEADVDQLNVLLSWLAEGSWKVTLLPRFGRLPSTAS
jgi:ABC-type sugar transport system substrate-binding protein